MNSIVQNFPLTDIAELERHNVRAETVMYRGRRAIKLVEHEMQDGGEAIAIVSAAQVTDGIIETTIAGDTAPDAPPEMRGFVGIAFRVQNQGAGFECFYLRPTNGRAEDQLRRNHATQYISHPDFPWYKLREEHPGLYESYTDLIPGVWTPLKIVVSGLRAQLYINNADQPCLIVNDLKRGLAGGSIGLWIGHGTVAHFSEVVVKPAL